MAKVMRVNLSYVDNENIIKFYVSEISNFWIREELIAILNKNMIKYDYKKSNISFELSSSKMRKHSKNIEIIIFLVHNDTQFEGNKKLIDKITYSAKIEEKIDNEICNYFNKIMVNKEIWNLEYDFLKVKPYEFQIKQANAMYAYKRISNFSSPGSGKTITSMISVINEYFKNNINFVFIFGPTSAKYTWTSESQGFIKFINDKVNIMCYDTSINGFDKDILIDALYNKNNLNLIFINFHKLQIDTGWYELITKFFNKNIGVIVDECHYFKNIQSKKFKRLKIISRHAKFCYLLSGTPIPKSINEAFYISNSLWPITKINLINNKLPFNMATEKYLLNFHKIFVRIDKNKNNIIKPLKIIMQECKPNIVEKYIMDKIYEEDYSFNQLDIHFQAKINKARIIRLMQAASSPKSLNEPLKESIKEIYEEETEQFSNTNNEESESIFDFTKNDDDDKLMKKIIKSSNFKEILKKYDEKNDPRIIKLIDLLDKLDNKRIIIWNVFRKSTRGIIEILREHFPKRLINYIDGTIVDFEREKAIESIRKSVNGILIASPASIAESISLHQEIDYAIYYFRNYIGSHWMQSLDRIHRLVGVNKESRNKYAYILMSKDSKYKLIDNWINNNLEKKIELQNKLLNKSFNINT